MSAKKIVSVRQLELLIDFLENHVDLALGRVRYKEGRILTQKLWQQCADILNAEDAGNSFRSSKEWNKFYNDYKCRIKNKARKLKISQNQTGGGPSDVKPLSPLEERLCSIIGNDKFENLPVQHDPLSKEAELEDIIIEETPAEQLLQNNSIYEDNISSEPGPSTSYKFNEDYQLNDVVPIEQDPNDNKKSKTQKLNKRKSSRNMEKYTELDKAKNDLIKLEEEKILLKRELVKIEKEKASALISLANAAWALVKEIKNLSPKKKKYKQVTAEDFENEN